MYVAVCMWSVSLETLEFGLLQDYHDVQLQEVCINTLCIYLLTI